MSGIFGGQQKDCITRKCAECTTNQHCSGGEFCTRYRCINPSSNYNGECSTNQHCPFQQYCSGFRCTNPNECNFDTDCPGFNQKCQFGNCVYDWSTGRSNLDSGSTSGSGSNFAIKIKPFGFDNIRFV